MMVMTPGNKPTLFAFLHLESAFQGAIESQGGAL